MAIDLGFGPQRNLYESPAVLGQQLTTPDGSFMPIPGQSGNTNTDVPFWSRDAAFGSGEPGGGGWAMPVIQGAGALMNGYMGMKQYGLAKDQLAFTKEAFNKNFASQSKLTNARLEDRQRARVASNPGAYQSVGPYMQKNGV